MLGFSFVTFMSKSLMILAIELTLSSVNYAGIAPFFAPDCFFFPANEKAFD